jgi:hypothetical protein
MQKQRKQKLIVLAAAAGLTLLALAPAGIAAAASTARAATARSLVASTYPSWAVASTASLPLQRFSARRVDGWLERRGRAGRALEWQLVVGL